MFQWLSTGFLWFTWLSHDVTNVAVFLPRQLSIEQLAAVIAVFVAGLAYIFYTNGGAIQRIVQEKTDTEYVRAATVIDLTYAFILLYFKEINSIPMSTTWVFVGLLAGRELAIASCLHGGHRRAFPLLKRDILKMMVGLGISVGLVLAVQWLAGSGV